MFFPVMWLTRLEDMGCWIYAQMLYWPITSRKKQGLNKVQRHGIHRAFLGDFPVQSGAMVKSFKHELHNAVRMFRLHAC